MNHSCYPNAALNLRGDPSKWHVVALRDIKPQESVRYNYCSTEARLISPFGCREKVPASTSVGCREEHEQEASIPLPSCFHSDLADLQPCKKPITGASHVNVQELVKHHDDWGVQNHIILAMMTHMCATDMDQRLGVFEALATLSRDALSVQQEA